GSGQRYCATLKWDSWPATSLDLDLYLVQLSNNVIVWGSADLQDGAQTPTESFCYVNPGATQAFALAVFKFSGPAVFPRLDIFSVDANLQFQVAAGSVVEPASAPSVMAVGAICWQNNGLQSYSSQGPTIDGRTKP